MDENLERIGHAMMLAWSRVKKANARMWSDWMVIGDGLLEGRRWAMQIAGTNRPEGKGYVINFAEWLKRYKIDDMHKADRAKLLQLMEERPAIEEWRANLPDYERRNLNNPTIVWRKWTADTREKKPKSRTAAVSGTEHGRARAMIEQLQARTAELEEEHSAALARIAELEESAARDQQSAAPRTKTKTRPAKTKPAETAEANDFIRELLEFRFWFDQRLSARARLGFSTEDRDALEHTLHQSANEFTLMAQELSDNE